MKLIKKKEIEKKGIRKGKMKEILTIKKNNQREKCNIMKKNKKIDKKYLK